MTFEKRFHWGSGAGTGKRFHPLAIAGMILGGVAVAIVVAFAFGWVVMLLWNWLMPEIFGLPKIGYWQGWGLLLLSHILLKPGYGHGEREGRGGRRGRGEWKAELKREFGAEGGEAGAGAGAGAGEKAGTE